MFQDKTVLLGVTGSIAAYKIATLCSMLKKKHCTVHVIMTKNAVNFITPTTFETLTGNKCLVDTFDRDFSFDVKHISLAKRADAVLIAPASANIIAKLCSGIADDMLTTTVLACTCKKLISPAMNTNMYRNPILQDNLRKLKAYGFEIITPQTGHLACGDIGEGKMPEPETLFTYLEKEIVYQKDLKGIRLLVTAGPTREPIDPVRYLTNHSSGKMGYAIAKAAMVRGADVTLITGETSLCPPMFVKTIKVTTANEMFEAVKEQFPSQDIIIKAAAVGDYTPKIVQTEKIKKSEEQIHLELVKTQDILHYIGKNKTKEQFLCGFSMETEHLIENSKKKLLKKNADMIVANNLKMEGAGFQNDTNVITIITAERELAFPKMSKQVVAHKILDEIINIIR